MPTAYKGDKPYIFVSYAHKDKAEVMRYIDALEKQGFLVWFDGGVEAGSEWPEYIASHLAASTCVLAFISENFAKSRNCRQELALSQKLDKDQLNVYISPVNLPLGMQMQLDLNQAMWRSNFDTEAAFLDELCQAKLIAACRDTDHSPQTATNPTPSQEPPHPAKQTPEERRSSDTPVVSLFAAKKKCKRLAWIGSLLELAYIPISIQLLIFLPSVGVSGFGMFLIMIIPHTMIAWINKRLFSWTQKRIGYGKTVQRYLFDASTSVLIFFLLASLASVIGAAFFRFVDVNFILRLLIALGLNIVPFFIAIAITASLDKTSA